MNSTVDFRQTVYSEGSRTAAFSVKTSLLLFLCSCLPLLAGQEKTVYIHSIPDVKPELSRRIQNISAHTILQSGGNFVPIDINSAKTMMGTFKREVQVDCQAKNCEKDLDERLTPDAKIIPALTEKEGKYTLNMKFYSHSENGFILERETEKEFYISDLENTVSELTRASLDPSIKVPSQKLKHKEEPAKKIPKEIQETLDEESKADELLHSFDFKDAVSAYKTHEQKIGSKQDGIFKKIRSRIRSKIESAEKTAPKYTGNQVKLFCAFAVRQNVRYSLSMKKNKPFFARESAKSIREILSKSENLIKTSDYNEPENNTLYNETLNSMNKEALISETDSDKPKNIAITKSTRRKAIGKSLTFPGLGQLYLEPESKKAKTIFYTGIGLAGLTAIAGLNFNQAQNAYSSYSPPVGNMSYFLPPSAQVPAYLIDTAAFDSQKKKLSSAAGTMNAVLGVFVCFYIYNLIDISFISGKPKSPPVTGLLQNKEGWNFISEFRTFSEARSLSGNREQFHTVSYSFLF
ncbi:MAG TPA: hypothetical protein PKA14_24795 [Leptospiraceae bacterium]|nr:hypothetical protein [Leptospiraceae bacterium]